MLLGLKTLSLNASKQSQIKLPEYQKGNFLLRVKIWNWSGIWSDLNNVGRIKRESKRSTHQLVC